VTSRAAPATIRDVALRAGVSWSPLDQQDYRHTFMIAADVEKRRDESARVGGGLEAWYENALALRVGGRTSPAAGTGLTLGLGVYIFRGERRGYELGFDYAFVAAGDFAQSHRAGLVFKFGSPITDDSHSAVFRKSSVYYENTVTPTRPRAQPADTPNDILWVKP